jgi:hypothetical protein
VGKDGIAFSAVNRRRTRIVSIFSPNGCSNSREIRAATVSSTRNRVRGVELVVIVQPDSSLACIPAWMTHEAAGQYALGEKPRFSVDILRSLLAETDAALLNFLRSEGSTNRWRHASRRPSVTRSAMTAWPNGWST